MQEKVQEAYAEWMANPTAENMGKVVNHMKPLLISQVSQYPGDNRILIGKAKSIAADAIRDYDPTADTRLTSWVVSRLQQLSRYGRQSRQVLNVPELAYRQYSELEAKRRELLDTYGREPSDDDLADAIGLSKKRINDIRAMNPKITSVGTSELTPEESLSVTDMPVLEQGSDPLLNTAIEAVYDSVDDRDRQIIDMKMGRKGNPVSNQEIASRLGVSPGFVSQRSLKLSQQIQDAYGI